MHDHTTGLILCQPAPTLWRPAGAEKPAKAGFSVGRHLTNVPLCECSCSHWTGNPHPYSVIRNGLTPHRSPLLHKDLKRAHRIATSDQLQKV
ncbi:hypothetical protein ALQ85_200030 [Pseudomonas syringae]|nr:hypothetical protein ALQ85_200030 [Pseudomonas syringae]